MTPRRVPQVHTRGLLAAVAAALVVLAAGTATAQAPPPGGDLPQIDQQLQNGHPKFLVRTWVDKKYHIYAEGQELTIKVRCEEDAYLYILYQQADGKLFQIFPNSGQPENRVKAMQDVQVPSLDDGFRWVVGAPFGKEVVKVIASKKPIDALSLPGLKEDHFNPVTREQVAGAGQELGKEPPNLWTEHDLKILTVKRGEPTEPPRARKRVGLFFGVADYEFNEYHKQQQRDLQAASGKVNEAEIHPMSLLKSANDARAMGRVLKETGRLDDVRVLLNAEVSRATIQDLVTNWLPTVTEPGDTVFIFFSGHGDQIPDDGQEENDGLDETIAPYETIDILSFMQLRKQAGAGQLPPALQERVRQLEPGYEQTIRSTMEEAGNAEPDAALRLKAFQRANGYLMRQTSVTDDELGHWIQKLDGRRVVVILDSCHSGGLNPTATAPLKGLKGSPRRAAGFDFLIGEFARLKDLNQPSLTVLAAASESQSSIERNVDENGMFTTSIIRLLERSGGPVDARQVIDQSRPEIAQKIREANDRRTAANRLRPPDDQLEMVDLFVPQLFTTDPQPVYLKPPAPTAADAEATHPED